MSHIHSKNAHLFESSNKYPYQYDRNFFIIGGHLGFLEMLKGGRSTPT